MKSLLLILIVTSYAVLAQSQELTLEDYLTQVKEQSLDLKIEQAKSDSLDAKSTGLAIPLPMIGYSQMKEQDGSSANGFEINQTIPFPTKLSGDHLARKYEFQSQEESKLNSQKQTLLKAKLSFLLLWQAQERQSLLAEKKEVLQDHIKISRSTARSDSFAAIHLLKAESDLDLLENEIESAKQTVRERRFDMAILTNTDPSLFKFTAVEPKISQIPKVNPIEESHLYKSKLFGLEGLKSKEFEAKSSWLPDFNLRYKEMGATNTSMKYNEVMVGITLPFVFFWEPYSASKQASRERLMGEYNLEKERRSFNLEKIVLISRLESLKKQLDTLNNKLIPRAEKRMKLVHNLAPRDMETLQDHRETMEAFPDLKMKALDFRIDYEKAVADLEKYVSTEDLQK
jgi:outer membrane protein, heavy metal efflux system